MKKIIIVLTLCLFSVITFAKNHQLVIKMYLTNENHQQGEMIGTVTATQNQYGLLLTPNLYDLPPGMHGFHIHTKPNCGDHGLDAKGHLDPKQTGKHLGPYNNEGHLGDLPVLMVNQKGIANTPMLAPKLKLSDLKGHALMIHTNGDNYSDSPKALGGGGKRIACGVIQ